MVQLGPTIEEAKRRFGEVKTPEPPTMRERDIGALRAFIEKNNLTEYLPGLATLPEGLYGDPDADTILGSLGIADFIPVPSLNTGINYGLVYGGQEALRDIEKAETGVDYVAPVVGLGLSALEAFPFLKVATKPTLGFLRSVGSKLKNIETDPGTKSFAEIEAGLSPEVREQYNLIRANRFLMDNEKIRTRSNPYRMPTAIPRADEPLIASPGPRIDKAPEPEKIDTSKRAALKGAAALGALSSIPATKIIDDIASTAPLKKAAKVLPKNFSLAKLKSFKKAVNAAKAQMRREYRLYDPDAIPEVEAMMDDMSDQEMLLERMDTGDLDPKDMVQEIRSRYPGTSSDDIVALFPEGTISKEAVDLIDPDSSFVEVPRDVAEDGNDFITIDELISIKLNDSSYNKSSKIYKTKKEVFKKLEELKKRYPDMEFATGYYDYTYPEITGHRIFYKKDIKDLISPANNRIGEISIPSDMSIDIKKFVPSNKAPK